MQNPLFAGSPPPRIAGLGKKALLGGGLLLASWAAFATEYGTVVSSTPWVTQVTVPQQRCFDEPQAVAPRSSGAGALAGAVIGGVIGHNIGQGGGRAAATGFGAVAGAVIGNEAELQNNPGGTVMVRRCHTVNGIESRVGGYDVVYDYQGRRYSSRLAQDPGEPGTQIPLEVNVSAAGAAAESYPPVTSPQVGSPPAVVYQNSTVEPIASEPPTTVYYTETVRPVYVAPAPIYYAPPVYYGNRPQFRGGTTIYFGGGGRIHDRHDDRRDNRRDDRRGGRPDDRRDIQPPQDGRRWRH